MPNGKVQTRWLRGLKEKPASWQIVEVLTSKQNAPEQRKNTDGLLFLGVVFPDELVYALRVFFSCFCWAWVFVCVWVARLAESGNKKDNPAEST